MRKEIFNLLDKLVALYVPVEFIDVENFKSFLIDHYIGYWVLFLIFALFSLTVIDYFTFIQFESCLKRSNVFIFIPFQILSPRPFFVNFISIVLLLVALQKYVFALD